MLEDFDIAVNCVTPAAATKTKIFDQISEEHIDYMLSKIPRNRFVKVDELASMVAWMVSEKNSFTTGAVSDTSGGKVQRTYMASFGRLKVTNKKIRRLGCSSVRFYFSVEQK